MRFWKLVDNSAVESHDDHVDISAYATEISKKEYDTYLSSLIPQVISIKTQLETDIATMDFVSLSDAKTKIKSILERIRKGER